MSTPTIVKTMAKMTTVMTKAETKTKKRTGENKTTSILKTVQLSSLKEQSENAKTKSMTTATKKIKTTRKTKMTNATNMTATARKTRTTKTTAVLATADKTDLAVDHVSLAFHASLASADHSTAIAEIIDKNTISATAKKTGIARKKRIVVAMKIIKDLADKMTATKRNMTTGTTIIFHSQVV